MPLASRCVGWTLSCAVLPETVAPVLDCTLIPWNPLAYTEFDDTTASALVAMRMPMEPLPVLVAPDTRVRTERSEEMP